MLSIFAARMKSFSVRPPAIVESTQPDKKCRYTLQLETQLFASGHSGRSAQRDKELDEGVVSSTKCPLHHHPYDSSISPR